MLKGADIVYNQLQELRTEAKFNEIFSKTTEQATELGLEPLSVPRPKKVPKKFEYEDSPAHTSVSAEDHFRIEYYKVIDMAQFKLKEYFTSTDLDQYCKLTDALLTNNIDTDYLEKYPELSDSESLKLQLTFFQKQFQPKKISDCHKLFKTMTSEIRAMFPLVEKLLRLILISPASACTAERSFSALRRLKTYLRSCMSQKRLNHLMLGHIHKDRLGDIDSVSLSNLFICNSTETRRKSTFGNVVKPTS